MGFKLFAAAAGLFLFLAYLGPLVVKLKDIPLAIVVIGGFILAAVDVWQSLGDRDS